MGNEDQNEQLWGPSMPNLVDYLVDYCSALSLKPIQLHLGNTTERLGISIIYLHFQVFFSQFMLQTFSSKTLMIVWTLRLQKYCWSFNILHQQITQMFIILQIQSRSLIKISSLKEYSHMMPCCRLLYLDMSIN